MSLADLPTLNAVLNASSAALLAAGYVLIRRGRRDAHRVAMLSALACSALFLASYLTYHAQVGSVRFTGEGPIRAVYFTVLISHTVLAVGIVPLVLLTATRALRGRYPAHRAIARVTLPLWAWVSASGVVVYWMLYRL
jgi:putative membrane protein